MPGDARCPIGHHHALALGLVVGAMERSRTSRAELVVKLGLSTSGLSRLLTGSRRLSVCQLARVLDACGEDLCVSSVRRDLPP